MTDEGIAGWLSDHAPAALAGPVLGLYGWQWLYLALLVGAARLTATAVRLLLQSQAERALARAGLVVDAESWRQIKAPLVWLVSIGVVTAGLEPLELHTQFADVVTRAARVVLWVTATLTLTRFVYAVARSARTYAQRTDSKLDDQAIPLVSQAARVTVLVVGGLYAIDAAGVDVWKLAAGVGLGGLALALAAQDTVANLFGSVNIFLDRPFQIGDWIKLGEVEGIVEEVGFRSTRVRTAQNSMVTLPNSKITSSNVDNFGVRTRRRVKFGLTVPFDTAPETLRALVAAIRQGLLADPAVQPDCEVHVNDLGTGGVVLLVSYNLVAADWHRELELRQDHILTILDTARTVGVAFAYPTTTVRT
ncbi:MAG: mechanosensitive ion channel family protein [Myxococcota bacterium]